MDFKRIVRGVTRRLLWVARGCPRIPPLLEMAWSQERTEKPEVSVPAGYTLRQYRPQDREAYDRLMAAAGMEPCSLAYWDRHILPDGFFVIECESSKQLVAACFASHHPTDRHPRAGNFGWLAADPAHGGKGLGRAVSAAVTARLIEGGYKNIYLETHDHRLPAIRIYLSMGWVPLLYCDEMHGRWERICEQLDWPYSPDQWGLAQDGS